jgi:hypothetical protein
MTKTRIRAIQQAVAKNSAHKAIIEECLAEIEFWQKKARAGLPLTEQASEPNEDAEEPPAANLFIARWCDEYLEVKGTKYIVARGKDTGHAKSLLKQIPDIDHLMKVARAAWKRPHEFNCKQAASLVGFCTRYNDIVSELRAIKQNSNGSNGGPVRVNL